MAITGKRAAQPDKARGGSRPGGLVVRGTDRGVECSPVGPEALPALRAASDRQRAFAERTRLEYIERTEDTLLHLEVPAWDDPTPLVEGLLNQLRVVHLVESAAEWLSLRPVGRGPWRDVLSLVCCSRHEDCEDSLRGRAPQKSHECWARTHGVTPVELYDHELP